MSRNERFIAELSCHHNAIYDPRPFPGDTVYCRICRDFKEVLSSHAEWSYACSTCRYARSCGLDEQGCYRKAQKHAVKFPGHTVCVRVGYKIVQKISVHSEHTTDLLDYLSAHPSHQENLRSLQNRDNRSGPEPVRSETAPLDGGNGVRSLGRDAHGLH